MPNLILRPVWLLFRPPLSFDQTQFYWYNNNYLFLRTASFASTYKVFYESKNVSVKKLHPTLGKKHVAPFFK